VRENVILAIIGGIVSVVGAGLAALANVKINRLQIQINSRMDELLATSRREAHAIGNAQGRAELKQENKNDQTSQG